MGDLRRKCNPMVDLSKFSSNKNILSGVIVSCYNQGKLILPRLSKAIEESLFAIVILSKNYASLRWCLNELVKIMECREKIGLIVVSIFYDVNPSMVQKQTRTYAKAFGKHEKRFQENIKRVHMWRDALKDVTSLSGWSLQNR